ncbi:hypothetical protein SAR11G3_00979 [Candidatus Pelagibacter sp. IMCC9063]|uniref:hypothetical protein n=1 Tax=Pelagibacter sp. (strain IMCC9063) TaxID=1002672 RepID=UPI0002046722|nr:hypothetical protein [Candidatus Pelagibacter sp. IMCC9063]AEA81454.1 hypothetical protein SAR11G3_00979 [Candidatus Pelagibacter sp. IMCC9063]
MKKLICIIVLSCLFGAVASAEHKGGMVKNLECYEGKVHSRWVNSQSEYFHIVLPERECKFTSKEIKQIRDKETRTNFIYGIMGFALVFAIPLVGLFKNKRKRSLKMRLKKNTFNLGKINRKHTFKNFWHGNKSLAASFWGFFIFGNIFFNILTTLFLPNKIIILLIYILLIIWNVLAVMGVFNSADIYKAKKIKAGELYSWATTAKVTTVILILSAIGNSLKYFI